MKEDAEFCLDCKVKIPEESTWELFGFEFGKQKKGYEYKEGWRCMKCHLKK